MTKKLSLLLSLAVILSACGIKKDTPASATPTAPPKVFDIAMADRPYISLIPSNDGHWLTLKLTKIPKDVSTIEYELIYNAADGSIEIEKGVSGTIKKEELSGTTERKLLLGTESCTSGCKYKYDEGVYGGSIMINFFTASNQVATYESPFTLSTSAKLKKEGQIGLVDDDFNIKTTDATGNDFFILIKNYNQQYSLFSSGNSPLAKDYQAE